MRFALMLATIPVVTLGSGYALMPSPPIVASTVAIEGVRAQRMDSETFRLRYAPVAELPPTIEVRHAAPRRDVADSAGTVPRLTPVSPPSRRLRSRAVRLDICARHGMRKVNYGKRWRCRR